MKITIETIPHAGQRYQTCGDWFYDPDGNINIRVSALGDWRLEAAVAVHELIEILLCKNDGVSQRAVDDFDIAYENDRQFSPMVEPGDDPRAPYHRQHCYATAVERMLIAALDLTWDEYANAVEALP